MLADRLVKPGGRISLVLPVTALSGESWREVRQMLASRYEVEFVVSSHDPNLLSMSYDTAIAEALLVGRRLSDGEGPTGVEGSSTSAGTLLRNRCLGTGSGFECGGFNSPPPLRWATSGRKSSDGWRRTVGRGCGWSDWGSTLVGSPMAAGTD